MTTALLLTFATLTVSPADDATRALKESLTFHATFDATVDADFARGDKRLYTTTTGKPEDGKPGMRRGDVTIVTGKGRFGDAVRFSKKAKEVVYYRGKDNVAYKKTDWSGTISFWLSLDPEKDLEPGYVDPIQITDKKWNDASLFVDFTKDDKPRHFRLGTFADYKVWNPKDRKFDDIPDAERPFVVVKKTPFARDKWTHVVMTLDGFNAAEGKPTGTASLYLDGKLQGTISGRPQTYTWDMEKANILLGLSYIGLFDDLALFDRALSAKEVETLYGLEKGVSELR